MIHKGVLRTSYRISYLLGQRDVYIKCTSFRLISRFSNRILRFTYRTNSGWELFHNYFNFRPLLWSTITDQFSKALIGSHFNRPNLETVTDVNNDLTVLGFLHSVLVRRERPQELQEYLDWDLRAPEMTCICQNKTLFQRLSRFTCKQDTFKTHLYHVSLLKIWWSAF